jgi:uncharacterized small protein (DUF1192 family)
MVRRRTSSIQENSLTTVEENLIQVENHPSSDVKELEERLSLLESKYEKLVSALRMNGAVQAALNQFYD